MHPGFVAPLVGHFDQADVFAVSATSYEWGTTTPSFGAYRLNHHHGSWYFERKATDQPAHTFFACGGFMAVDRLKFLEVGGFHPLFRPAYFEDVEICLRAWRRGWRTIYEPRSRVEHRESASFGGAPGGRAARLLLRGRLLFIRSRLPSPPANVFEHLGYMLLETVRRMTRGEFWWLKGQISGWLEWRKVRHLDNEIPLGNRELMRLSAEMEKPVILAEGDENDSLAAMVSKPPVSLLGEGHSGSSAS